MRLFTPEMLADPYSVYRQLRITEPVHWHEPFGAWVLSSYSDICAAFTDPRLSSQRAELMSSLAADERLSSFFSELSCRMDFQDPPAHGLVRGLVSKAFTPKTVDRLREGIQAVVDELIDAAMRKGSIDVIADLAVPLPTIVIAQLLGADIADRDHLKHLCDVFVGFFKTVPSDTTVEEYERSSAAADELRRYFRGVVADPSKQAWAHLLADLTTVEMEGRALSEDEWAANATLLLHAGNETTTNLIGNGLLALLRHPEQLQRLQRLPALLDTAVEELLRYDSPIQLTYRVAREDLQISGTTIRRGELVHLLLGSANRDPDQFPAPDRLDIERKPNRHLAFAHGPHFCLGAPLTRLEARLALGTLIRRLPEMRLAETEPTFQDNYVLRGLTSLRIAP